MEFVVVQTDYLNRQYLPLKRKKKTETENVSSVRSNTFQVSIRFQI